MKGSVILSAPLLAGIACTCHALRAISHLKLMHLDSEMQVCSNSQQWHNSQVEQQQNHIPLSSQPPMAECNQSPSILSHTLQICNAGCKTILKKQTCTFTLQGRRLWWLPLAVRLGCPTGAACSSVWSRKTLSAAISPLTSCTSLMARACGITVCNNPPDKFVHRLCMPTKWLLLLCFCCQTALCIYKDLQTVYSASLQEYDLMPNRRLNIFMPDICFALPVRRWSVLPGNISPCVRLLTYANAGVSPQSAFVLVRVRLTLLQGL